MRRTVKRLVDPVALAGNDDAGEKLDAFLVAFAHLGVHADAVADLEGGHVLLHLAAVSSLMIGFMAIFQ